MSDNQNSGSFIFVKPSANSADKTYEQNPKYPYVLTAWEWLLERTLRRKLLLKYFKESAGLAALASRKNLYRLDRKELTDRDGDTEWVPSVLVPTGETYSGSNEPRTENVPVKYGAKELISDIEALLGDDSFLAPDWEVPSDYRHTAKKETTSTASVSADGTISWHTAAACTPYDGPWPPFFGMLADVRVDDPAVSVEVTDSEGGRRSVKLAKTKTAISRSGLTEWDGVKILDTGYSEVNSSKFFATPTDPDNPKLTGSSDGVGYGGPPGVYDVADLGVVPTRGMIPRTDGSPIYTNPKDNWGVGHIIPDIQWGDGNAPTWWHANGFPKGLDSVISPRLRAQLKALSVTQPAVPPSLPYLSRFPEDGFTCYGSDGRATGADDSFAGWPANTLAFATTPYCAHKMLDALTTTVFKVDEVFCRMSHTATKTTTKVTENRSTQSKSTYDRDNEEWNDPVPTPGWTPTDDTEVSTTTYTADGNGMLPDNLVLSVEDETTLSVDSRGAAGSDSPDPYVDVYHRNETEDETEEDDDKTTRTVTTYNTRIVTTEEFTRSTTLSDVMVARAGFGTTIRAKVTRTTRSSSTHREGDGDPEEGKPTESSYETDIF